MARLDDIKAELDVDPLGRGYAGMTAVEAANNMNVEDRSVLKSSIPGHELFAQTDSAEYLALTADKKTEWLGLCGLDSVIPTNSSPAVPIVEDIFGNPSATRTALIAYRSHLVSRGVEINVGLVREQHVIDARNL